MCEFSSLVEIMEKLRSPEGCPWDREQDHKTLRQYLLEETYEVLEKIDLEDPDGLREELGDLLLQIVFHAQIAKEKGLFSIHDVVRGIMEKLVRRHPHVFGDFDAHTPDEVSLKWEKIKEMEENRTHDSLLGGIPNTLPALHRTHKLSRRAAKVGFDWENVDQIFEKTSEEISELKEAIRENHIEKIEEEVGDLLFAVANISRFMGINPEIALTRTNRKFERRFRHIEKLLRKNGEDIGKVTLDRMEELWCDAKDEEKRKRD